MNISITFQAILSHIPILGICFGMQIINNMFGGTLKKLEVFKKGYIKILPIKNNKIKLKRNSIMMSSHSDHIDTIAPNFKISAMLQNNDNDNDNDIDIIQGIEHTYLPIYGVQFHPEMSPEGHKYIDRFLAVCYNL